MNCEDFENNVNDLAREQLMDAGVRLQALTHRDECSACARRLAEESALSFKLRALAADLNSVTVPALGSEVLAALRERQLTAITRSRFRTRVVAATATAAAAALVFGVLAFAFMRSSPPPSTVQSPKNLPVEKDNGATPQLVAGSSPALPGKVAAPRGLLGQKQGPTRNAALAKTATRHSRENVVATETTARVVASYPVEVTTDFFPVGYGSATSLGDGGQLVRVELPRSALVAFGVPMNVNRYDERVKADVLFGADGMAHAIRFVQ